jgi:uncharacterized membrane protein
MKTFPLALCMAASMLLANCAQQSGKQAESAVPAPTAAAPTAAVEQVSPFDAKKAQGIDFVGAGTEPFWGLDIDFDQSMRFYVAGGDTFNTPAVMVNPRPDGTMEYLATTESGKLKVSIKKQTCSDGMSDNQYAYTVAVEAKGQAYSGCGTYLAGALGSYWTLKTINGAAPAADAFPKGKLPTFSVHQGNWAGSDGCNSGGGKVMVNGNNIKIEPGRSTLMACPGNGSDTYKKALHSATAYKLDGNTLYLMAGDKEVLKYGL